MLMIGVLGGMGPLATVDFFNKVLAATPAQGDADHVPLLIQSDPRISPRPAAIFGFGRSPLPELLAGRDRLISAGATMLAMPCNTAHFWYSELIADCSVPFISIVETTLSELAKTASRGSHIGIIATKATLAAKIFDKSLTKAGYFPLLPQDDEMEQLVLPGIDLVKAGEGSKGGVLIAEAVQALLQRGADVVLLACTETPLALDAVQSPLRLRCVDSTATLARACVAWWQINGSKSV